MVNYNQEEEEEKYEKKFFGIRAIFEKHITTADDHRLTSIVHHFIAAKETALAEAWDIGAEQENLSNLRKHIQGAAAAAEKIHRTIEGELFVNLTLPLEVLNGTYDRKTCDEKVFELAPNQEKVDSIKQVLTGLVESSETLDKVILYTQNDLPDGIRIRNRNIEAWRIVEGAVETCRSYSGYINVPNSMGPSGPFRRLLVDLFEYYGMSANVEGAFNGWVKHIDRKREFFDLLPID